MVFVPTDGCWLRPDGPIGIHGVVVVGAASGSILGLLMIPSRDHSWSYNHLTIEELSCSTSRLISKIDNLARICCDFPSNPRERRFLIDGWLICVVISLKGSVNVNPN